MARQHSCYMTYKAVQFRWYFPPKLVELPDGRIVDATPRSGHTYVRGVNWPIKGRGRGESLYSDRRVDAKFRACEVVRLRFAGYTWQAIATNLGFADRSGAWRACRRMFDQVDRERFLKCH